MAQRKAFLLRIDGELWTELERWAAEDLRSVNGQIEYLLREVVRRRKGEKPEGHGERSRGSAPDGPRSPAAESQRSE